MTDKKDKIKLAELISALGLFGIAIVTAKFSYNKHFEIHNYCWVISLLVMSITQFVSIFIDKVLLRISMGWISGVIWTWFAFTSLNTLAYFIALAVGSLNIYASIMLSNLIYFDWCEFFKE